VTDELNNSVAEPGSLGRLSSDEVASVETPEAPVAPDGLGRLSSDEVASVETPEAPVAPEGLGRLSSDEVASVETPEATPVRRLGVGEIENALHDVVDPELGINVVDLGLVYDIKVDENNYVTIDMTLTTPACPLNDILEEDVAEVLKKLPITGHRVQWVWQPLWSPDLITEEGRQQLQMIGFHI